MEIIDLNFSRWTKGDDASVALRFQVSGSDDEETVLLFAEGNTPAIYKSLYRNQVDGELVGPELWEISVRYGATPPPSWNSVTVTPEWSFSIDEETVHVSHSITTVNAYAASGTAADHKGAINVQPDGTIEGADVGVSALSWSETLYLPWAAWGPGYLQVLQATVTRWNSTAWRIWAPGEVLLRRARGRPAGQAFVSIEFDFAVSPNVTGLAIGAITGIDKLGWDYLWVQSEEVEDTTAKANATRPKYAYVERLRYSANFNNLLLPNPFV